MKFDNYLVHASAFSKLMTEPKSAADKAAGNLSATTKQFLREIYVEHKYGRRKTICTKQMLKGTLQEEEAITLYCRVKKHIYCKNTARIENKFITGEPDLSDNEDIFKTKRGVDIKCSWSLFTFPFPDDKLDKSYEWQNLCYMCLSGAEEWATAFCLVNAPGFMILDEKKKLYYEMGCPADDDPTYIEGCIEIEKNMIFNLKEFKAVPENKTIDLDCKDWHYDIPLNERVVEFPTIRDDFKIELIEPTVIKARKYLNGCSIGEF